MAKRRRQRGSIILWKGKRGSVWRIKYADATGRAVMETIGPETQCTRRDVEAELRERLVRVDKDRYAKPKALTFRDYAEQWFEQEEAKRNWKPTTVVTYVSVRRRLVEGFGPKRLEAIRPRDVADYIADLSKRGYGAPIVRRDVAVMHAMFKSAKRAELVASNPCEGAELPRLPDFQPWILNPEEVRAIAGTLRDPRARVLFLTLELTGVRRHEATQLRWRDVDLVDGVLRVVKSKSSSGVRSIALSRTLTDALVVWKDATAYQGEDEYVFADPEHGRRLSAEWFKAELTAAMKTAGVDRIPDWTYRDAAGRRRGGFRVFHDNRHTSITNDARSASPIAVKVKAGHSSLSTTEKYIHLAGTEFRDEAEALERRLFGEVSTEPSTNLTAPEPTSANGSARNEAVYDVRDRA
jgi:integrase